MAGRGELTLGTKRERPTQEEPEESPLVTNHYPLTIDPSASVSLHPSLALGMLQAGQAAAGRLWLVLRYLDKEGRGWLRLDMVQEKLTAKEAELRICGRRQLRNLLRQGGGLFWKRDKERVWLKSTAKVAAGLGVERLSGRPVKLPVTALLGGIGQVRAHFYASFHSGRIADNPISRAKLEEITHVPERTQRIYEQASGVRSRPNFAVGERNKAEHIQERAWRHGRGTFNFVDHDGRFGTAGNRYVAWRLPNSYKGPHEAGPRGRQKKINLQIDLVNLGAQGNDLRAGSSTGLRRRLFHQDGQGAAKSFNRDPEVDAYWSPDENGRDRGDSRLWHVIGGRPAPARSTARASKPALDVRGTEV